MKVFLGLQLAYFYKNKTSFEMWYQCLVVFTLQNVYNIELEIKSEVLVERSVFIKKIGDSVFDDTPYVWSIKGLPTLSNAVKKLKSSAFTQTIQRDSITAFESNVRGLQAAYPSKDSKRKRMQRKVQNLTWRKYGGICAL